MVEGDCLLGAEKAAKPPIGISVTLEGHGPNNANTEFMTLSFLSLFATPSP